MEWNGMGNVSLSTRNQKRNKFSAKSTQQQGTGAQLNNVQIVPINVNIFIEFDLALFVSVPVVSMYLTRFVFFHPFFSNYPPIQSNPFPAESDIIG